MPTQVVRTYYEPLVCNALEPNKTPGTGIYIMQAPPGISCRNSLRVVASPHALAIEHGAPSPVRPGPSEVLYSRDAKNLVVGGEQVRYKVTAHVYPNGLLAVAI